MKRWEKPELNLYIVQGCLGITDSGVISPTSIKWFFLPTVLGGCYCTYGFWASVLRSQEVSRLAHSFRASGFFHERSRKPGMGIWQRTNTDSTGMTIIFTQDFQGWNVSSPFLCAVIKGLLTMQSNNCCCFLTHIWQIFQKWSCEEDFKKYSVDLLWDTLQYLSFKMC